MAKTERVNKATGEITAGVARESETERRARLDEAFDEVKDGFNKLETDHGVKATLSVGKGIKEPPPRWHEPKEALVKLRKQQDVIERLEYEIEATQDQLKVDKAQLKMEQSELRAMLRDVRQLKLFALMLSCLLFFAGCNPLDPQDPFGLPDPTPIEDRPMLHLRFYVEVIEPGVGFVVDRETDRAWLMVGSPASWQAVTPIGEL